MPQDLSSLLQSMGQQTAGYDFETNRTRTSHANRLRELAAQGLSARKQISEGMATQGLTHSGANLEAQTDVNKGINAQRFNENEQYVDKLSNIARSRIREQTQFDINSMLPR